MAKAKETRPLYIVTGRDEAPSITRSRAIATGWGPRISDGAPTAHLVLTRTGIASAPFDQDVFWTLDEALTECRKRINSAIAHYRAAIQELTRHAEKLAITHAPDYVGDGG